MNKNEAAIFLDYYLDKQTESEFAVMLDGPWGAGKTHFIKKYLLDRASHTENLGKRIHLYASLYGITSPTEITDQFFAQAHPILNSKASRLFGSIASKALNGLVGTDVNSNTENRAALQEMVLKLEGEILIFDDLERCSMPIGDVLGFINTFVEHENLKVIILANESDIPNGQKITYNKQKEKLIGKTIQVKSDPNEVIEKFITCLKTPSIKHTITSHKNTVLSTFLASGKHNYRNLRAVLSEYERLVNSLDPRLQESPEGMKQLLLYMIATGHEYRSGELDAKTMHLLPTSLHYIARRNNSPTKSQEVEAFEKLKNKYTDVKWIDPIIAPTYLADIYQSGLISIEAINNALSQHPVIVGYAQAPAWRQLWSWTDLPKEQYVAAKSQILAQLSNHELTIPGIILHVAGSILTLKQFDDRVLGSRVNIVTYFKNYLEELLQEKVLSPDSKAFGHGGLGYGGLGFGAHDSEEFKSIYKLVEHATKLACAQKMKEISQTYTQRLKSDSDAYDSLHEYGFENENYAGIAFLHNVNTAEFAKLLIIDSCPNDKLLASLTRRYEGEHHHSHRLSEEYPWLDIVKNELKELIRLETPPHKQLLTMRIDYHFELIEKEIRPSN